MFNFNIVTLFILLGLVHTKAMAQENCLTYLELEQEYQCGSKGYLLGYGHHYCKRFTNKNIDRFTPEGQLFLIKNAQCLQDKLKQFTELNPTASCQSIKDYAIKTHMTCYQTSGFCGLRNYDKLSVLAIIRSEVKYRYVRQMASQILRFCRHNKK
ncbi:MAG: hypothetical protein Fur0010_19140 [Bdellovibrio sp.]